MSYEDQPHEPLPVTGQESDNPEEQKMLDTLSERISPERRPKFIGYLKKYRFSVEQSPVFADFYINNCDTAGRLTAEQVAEFRQTLEQRRGEAQVPKRKAA